MPTPTSRAPGTRSRHPTSGGWGKSLSEATSQRPAGTSMKSEVANTHAGKDRSCSLLTSCASTRAPSTERMSRPTARACRRTRTRGRRQISTWMTVSTLTRLRAPSTRAKPLMPRIVSRLQTDWSPTFLMVVASRPAIPALSAADATEVPVASTASPKATTKKKTNGTMNRNTRKATAPARIPPPTSASRSYEPKAMSMRRERGRLASAWDSSSSARARALATASVPFSFTERFWSPSGSSTPASLPAASEVASPARRRGLRPRRSRPCS